VTEAEDAQHQGVPLRAAAREIIAELRPVELPSFDRLEGLDDQEVTRLVTRTSRHEALGSPAVEVITPTVVIALNALAGQFGVNTSNAVTRGIKAVTRKILRRTAEPVVVPQFEAEQLSLVEKIVRDAAKRHRLSERTVDDIANAVVARLALPPEKSLDPGAPGSGSERGARP